MVCGKNGREAIDLVTAHQPAVVITDWEMPDITGLQLCEQIRRDHDSYRYIILLTSNTKKNQIIEGLAAGADDYLTKPFHPGELLARVAVGRRIAELHRQVQAKNRLLEELALTDSLTGLPNGRAIEHWATRELKGADRHGYSFWVVMADLDLFKNVNDTYGHETGDLVLQKFAELLKANTRSSNMCGRIGGEEFVLVLSHIGKEDVVTAIERIRRLSGSPGSREEARRNSMSCFERQIWPCTQQSAVAVTESSSRPHFPPNRMFWSRAARVWISHGTEQPPRREGHARSELTKLKSEPLKTNCH